MMFDITKGHTNRLEEGRYDDSKINSNNNDLEVFISSELNNQNILDDLDFSKDHNQ